MCVRCTVVLVVVFDACTDFATVVHSGSIRNLKATKKEAFSTHCKTEKNGKNLCSRKNSSFFFVVSF